MKYLPIFLSLLVYGISYHGMYLLTDQFWSQPNLYCKINSTPQEYDICTKSVVIGGFLVIIIPVGLGIGTYVITDRIQKKEKELLIK